MNNKIKIGLSLFFAGFLGLLTILTATLPLEGIKALEKFSPGEVKLLILIQPTILLMIAVFAGTMLYDKIGLALPTISSILKIEQPKITFSEQLKFGILSGLLAGILTMVVQLIFSSAIPQEFINLGNKVKLTPLARFGYGGITEELFMRFGFMTFVIWIISKIFKKLNDSIYWTGIIISTLLFAFGHFPMVFTAIKDPAILLLVYVLIGNSIAGLCFGWLYWKKGLEAACIAHIFFHVPIVVVELFKSQQNI
jgi:hypothetical protein